MTLNYVGAPIANASDLAYRDYLTGVKAQDLTQAEVDSVINAGMAPYANRTYVDAQDMLLATQSYIDAQDNTRVRLLHKNIANGVPGLDATGKIDPSFIYTATNDQKWNRGLWSPSAYNTDEVSATTTEVVLYTCPVTHPGYPYRLVVTGLVDARSNISTEHPVIRVRVGSLTGEIIAMGRGQNEAIETFQFGDEFNRTAADLGNDWSETYYEAGEGTFAPNGSEAVWNDVGNQFRSLRARRTNSFDRYTGTNYQAVVARIGSVIGEANWFGQGDQYLRLYGRMNDAETQYVYAQISEDRARLIYANNGAEAQIGGDYSVTPSTNTPFLFYTGLPSAPRTFWLFKNSTPVFQIEDTGALTALGPDNRGWGFGVRAAPRNLGQTSPPHLDYVKAFEPLVGYSTVVVSPRRLDQMTILNAPTTLYVTLSRSATASTATATSGYPKLNVLAYAA